MTSAISSLVKIRKISLSHPESNFVWKIWVVFFFGKTLISMNKYLYNLQVHLKARIINEIIEYQLIWFSIDYKVQIRRCSYIKQIYHIQFVGNNKDNSLPCGFTIWYRAVHTSTNNNTWNTQLVDTNTTDYIIHNLLAYTTYEIYVKALNDACSRSLSQVARVTTHEKGITY